MYYIKKVLFLLTSILIPTSACLGQISDDFEQGINLNWYGDDCGVIFPYSNPFSSTSNTSNNVLQYTDSGGSFANVGLDVGRNLNMSKEFSFTLMVYIPSNTVTGNQPTQVSLKLQDNRLAQPWSTQTEIIKTTTTDQWNKITFNFKTDNFKNLDPNSDLPTARTDFNRVVIQINGEGNNDKVTAYIDNFIADASGDTTQSGNGPIYNRLVWSDEFNGSGTIDTSKWFHQTELPNGNSWYNGEIQHYTNRTTNSYESNGNLHIIAKKESFTDQGVTKTHTSARLNSKFAFTYGRVEVRAKLPDANGTWPAIWMLGKNIIEPGAYWTQQFGTVSWPACGEIDIIEHWGSNPNFVQSAIHTPSSHGGTINKGGKQVTSVKNDFHLYAMDWYEDRIEFSLDSAVFYVYKPDNRDMSTWPFVADQYILLNIAVEPSIPASFNQDEMVIDYVRVYQEGNSTAVTKNQPSNEPLFKVYPNPVNDWIELNFGSNEPNGMITISDLNGNIILQEQGQFQQLHRLNTQDLSRGLFLVSFQNEITKTVHRFMKQ